MLHGTCVCNVFCRSLGDPSLRFLQRQILFFWSLDCDFAKQMSVGLGCPRQIKVCIQYASLSILGKPNMIASTLVHCGNGQYPSLKDNLFSVCYCITINLKSRTRTQRTCCHVLWRDGFACRFLLECETALSKHCKESSPLWNLLP
jgi:hypothetical protein